MIGAMKTPIATETICRSASRDTERHLSYPQFHGIVDKKDATCYHGAMYRWTIIFKALSNINRMKVIQLLKRHGSMNVGDIANALDISVTATSNHLVLLEKLGVLVSVGKGGHVLYALNQKMSKDFSDALALFR